jgi:hypothetical protein
MNGLYKLECYIALGWKGLTNAPAYWDLSKKLSVIYMVLELLQVKRSNLKLKTRQIYEPRNPY